MKIQIIADSTCDLDPALTGDTGLEILPLTITIRNKNYMDGEELKASDLYAEMQKGAVPQTSQIPPDRIYSLFRACFESGSDFIYIAFSSEMSGCYALAVMIAGELENEYPDSKYAVVDSRGGSSATGLIVLQALRMARDGLPFETVLSEIQYMVRHVQHVFSVGDLVWLSKGGRLPALIGYVGSKLNVHPILEVTNGRIVVRQMVRGKMKAIETVAGEIIRRAGQFTNQLIAISHSDDLPSAKILEKLVREGLPKCSTTLCHIGGVIGAHIGLNGVGAFCLARKPVYYKYE